MLTYVGPQEDKQVAAAIRRELLRDGQVFYIHNKVSDIEKTARHLRTLVPEARIVVAHGQMSEQVLEQTVQGFWNRDYDVMVCTTIVETGLDIANANTLIVENAQNMGLSQLHQLRGRVGRGGFESWCLFHTLADQGSPSFTRVQQVAATTDGFKLAELDLLNRREGDVLGKEQSGLHRTLRLINLVDDRALVERAYRDAGSIVADNLEFARSATADFVAEDFEYLDKS